MSEPWTRREQINYATFGKKEGSPEYEAVWAALMAFAEATEAPRGESILTHFIQFHKRHIDASKSVD